MHGMDPFDLVAAAAYPARIDALAARLMRQGDEVRSRAGLLVRASGACEWDGAGASAFRAKQSSATARLGRVADLLEDCCRLLRHHAAAVGDEVTRELAAVARRHPR